MPTPYRYWIAAIFWLGGVFRFRALFANHFHADEALFASWARHIAVWRDPLLLAQPVDKPPLLFYLQALFFPFFGPVEWAARLPNFLVSLLLVPLIGVLAWRLYGDHLLAGAAALLVALSPLAIQFSATAFTDPLLTFWLVAAITLALDSPSPAWPAARPVWAGVCFGLAAATKYQAWLFLPLLAALAALSGWRWREWRQWLAGFIPIMVAVVAWVFVRSSGESLVATQVANIGGLRPVWSWELLPRLWSWARLWQISLGWPLLLATAGAVAYLLLARSWRADPDDGYRSRVDAVLLLFVVGYGLLHWLWAVPVWDRYLLPLLPFVLLLVARALTGVARRVRSLGPGPATASTVAALVLTALLLWPATRARQAAFPIGGQPTADQGAWFVAEHLRDAPYGTVLYDHWYSWQWRYHLFDTGVYVSWFPHAGALVEDLAVFGAAEDARYLVLPDLPVAEPVQRALAEAGYRLACAAGCDSGADALQMVLYRVERQNP